jgi:hypothetical protein
LFDDEDPALERLLAGHSRGSHSPSADEMPL